eukprot:TRINITY_DN17_c0_g1_i1.p1 TRINITY_DN17_c0_g1~~TRINITY_DN17_c0_g1_i1.p1  ORF type:complete len:294 (+),score=78.89 TRINITY_DN17_c0_g1_i1:48-884(+)
MKASLCMALLCATAVSGTDLGDRMMRTYTKYVDFPTTALAAKNAGWVVMNGGSCDPRYGVGFSNGTVVDHHHPTILYFTLAGQVSGITVNVYGAPPPEKLVNMKYFEKISDKVYRLGVVFRENPCMTSNSTDPIGDRLVLSPGGAAKSLPLTRQDAVNGNWTAGSCFYGMGTHHFYDVSTIGPAMSWQAENLLPVVTMFNNNGDIQAFFFASWTVEEQIFNGDNWEPIPLDNPLFCKNMCDPACTFAGTNWWSTYHVYFRDLDLATCPNNCKIGCCSK